MSTTVLRFACLVCVLGLLSGCATNELNARLDAIEAKADRALAASQEAQRLSADAMATANANEEKMNRAFRSSMLK